MAEGVAQSTPLPPSQAALGKPPRPEWEYEWSRCLAPETNDCDKLLNDSFRPGSIEGIWEGLFTVRVLCNSGDPELILSVTVHRIHGLRSAAERRITCKFAEKHGRAPSSDMEAPRASSVGFGSVTL